MGFEKYGSEEALEKDAIKHLYEVYVKISTEAERDPEVKAEAAKWFRRMEDGLCFYPESRRLQQT